MGIFALAISAIIVVICGIVFMKNEAEYPVYSRQA